MAMRENIRNIEEVITTSSTLQKKKDIEKARKEEEKEDLKRIEHDVVRFLRHDFQKNIYKLRQRICYNIL